jgi:biotin operon repressor
MSNKDFTKLVRALQQQGVRVKKTKKSHICVITPKGPVYCASTPSDGRAIKNAIAMLKRKGIKIDR